MTLYDYLKLNKEEEVTVTDKDYDTESYWYWHDENEEKYHDEMEIAKHLKVVKINNWNVVCNISDVVEKHIDELNDADLFCLDITETEDIMEDWDDIIAGYVLKEWMKKFSEILCK